MRCLLGLLFGVVWVAFAQGQSPVTYLIVGSYTQGKPASGIHVFAFDGRKGRLRKVSEGQDLVNPSFLTLSADGRHVYACTDTRMPGAGSVTAFHFDPATGSLTLLGKQPSGGENPVYVSMSPDGSHLICANYTEGTLTAFPVAPDGGLLPYVQRLTFSGQGPLTQRQDKPHVHAAVFAPDGRFLIVPDLGADRIRVFEFQKGEEQPLRVREDLDFKAVPGSGPRHFVFHPQLPYAYCVEELSGTLMAFRYAEGRLDSLQRLFAYRYSQELYSGADVHISPDGRFLYASNRLENTLAICSIDPETGRLVLKGHESTVGDHPRNFTLDPTGRYLLAGNLMSDSIMVFRRNAKTGQLHRRKAIVTLPQPSCLQMRVYAD